MANAFLKGLGTAMTGVPQVQQAYAGALQTERANKRSDELFGMKKEESGRKKTRFEQEQEAYKKGKEELVKNENIIKIAHKELTAKYSQQEIDNNNLNPKLYKNSEKERLRYLQNVAALKSKTDKEEKDEGERKKAKNYVGQQSAMGIGPGSDKGGIAQEGEAQMPTAPTLGAAQEQFKQTPTPAQALGGITDAAPGLDPKEAKALAGQFPEAKKGMSEYDRRKLAVEWAKLGVDKKKLAYKTGPDAAKELRDSLKPIRTLAAQYKGFIVNLSKGKQDGYLPPEMKTVLDSTRPEHEKYTLKEDIVERAIKILGRPGNEKMDGSTAMDKAEGEITEMENAGKRAQESQNRGAIGSYDNPSQNAFADTGNVPLRPGLSAGSTQTTPTSGNDSDKARKKWNY